MKYNWIILLLFISLISNVSAQSRDIIKELNTDKKAQGIVRVYQDESLEGLLGSKKGVSSNTNTAQPNTGNNSYSNNPESTPSDLKPTHYIQTKGYRIQVFSGNDQKRSKNEAYSRKSLIQNSFPDMDVTITFNSPVWRARAGNFKTYEQAYQALNELKSAFPSFGKEMQVVESVIKLPVY